MKVYFSDFFEVDPELLEDYGAFNISLITDLPLFIDPFLLFNSEKQEYIALHDQMIDYLRFLREKSVNEVLTDGLIYAWYAFPEVKQNWLGFSISGNRGSGLGRDFAVALHQNLNRIFTDFGRERVTTGSHIEKLCLFRSGVGKDNISDFTTNLIKGFLLEYTQTFAQQNIKAALRRRIHIPKAKFNYVTQSWTGAVYDLPYIKQDYVLLTPQDILTRDETWINKHDLYDDFLEIPPAIPDEHFRAQVNDYFIRALGEKDSKPARQRAAAETIQRYPELIDYYIKFKEDTGEIATDVSTERVAYSKKLYIDQLKEFAEFLARTTDFYQLPGNTYDEAMARVTFLKHVIEDNDGYRLFYVNGKPVEREKDLQILYKLTWFATPSDMNSEVNNGRGAVDFKISRGSKDKTLVEFKIASNKKLKRNLENQVAIYEKANDTLQSIKVILYFSADQLETVSRILDELRLSEARNIVLIDARSDNKPSASTA